MTDEEYVRAHWEDDLIWSLSSGVPADHELWGTERWAAAAESTRERLEQIRQLEAEITELELARDELMCSRAFRISRILARLESALADLKRGMKGAD